MRTLPTLPDKPMSALPMEYWIFLLSEFASRDCVRPSEIDAFRRSVRRFPALTSEFCSGDFSSVETLSRACDGKSARCRHIRRQPRSLSRLPKIPDAPVTKNPRRNRFPTGDYSFKRTPDGSMSQFEKEHFGLIFLNSLIAASTSGLVSPNLVPLT